MIAGRTVMAEGGHFLSAENPIANVDQRDLEDVALRLRGHPAVIKARSISEVLWRNVMTHSAVEQMDRFEAMLNEFVFNFILRAVNSEGSYPKILRHMQPPHRWFGHDVPGSRWGGDSPDFVYRSIPIDHAGRYEIRGWPACETLPSVTYTLMANMPSLRTFAILDSLDMAVEADGSFLVTIDASPAVGRDVTPVFSSTWT